MKNLFSFLSFFLLIVIITFTSCDEVPVIIDRPNVVDPIDPTLTNQMQNVLIEEYTGVRCVNCPAGSELIEQLIGIHGSRLVAVAIHGGQFATAYPSSREDLKIADGERLITDVLGPPQGYPAAVVNRKEHPESFGLELVKDDWAGVISVQKDLTPKVAIILETQYNAASRSLSIESSILQKENLNANDVRLTLLITESEIIDTQLTPDGLNEDYEHNHVLRGFVSAYNGDQIGSELTLNEVLVKNHSIILPDNWSAGHIEVVGIVHLNDDTVEALQTIRTKPVN